MKKSKQPKRVGPKRSRTSESALKPTIRESAQTRLRAAIQREKQPKRFSTGFLTPNINHAARDLVDSVLCTRDVTRLLYLSWPNAEAEGGGKRPDVALVLMRGPKAAEFAEEVRKDPRWR